MIRRFLSLTIHNAVFANMLMLLILCSGFFAASRMIREVFPRFSLDLISVSVPYPGADPDEIEEGICLKLEEALEGIEGIKKINTIASEGLGQALVECQENAVLNQVKDDVVTQVDTITTFPEEAEKPVIREIKFRGDVMGIAVWGDLPEHQLRDLAQEIKDELLALKGISQVTISGSRDYEISIDLSEEKLRQFGLTFSQVSAIVARSSLNLPAGLIRTETEELRLRTQSRGYTATEYQALPVISRPDGTMIRLMDIATVRDSFDEDVQVSATFNGKTSLSVDVFKTEEEDAIRISKTIFAYLDGKRRQLPPNVHLTPWRDNSRFVQGRLNTLVSNGRIGLLLVFLSLWFFLDLRLSFWVTMGIPISLAGGLALMGAAGESLNMLSLFGLIMVLGLIVDDAIVVGEAIYVHRNQGEDGVSSAVAGACEVAWPVVAAVATTIVAFLPLFFVGGIMGKFIGHIPIPVVAALSVSLAEALLILPVHLRHLPELRREPRGVMQLPLRFRRRVGASLEWVVERLYGPAMDVILRWRYAAMAMAVSVLLVTVGLVQGGVIKYIIFPEADSDFLLVRVELPSGTPLSETRAVSRQLLEAWSRVEQEVGLPDGRALAVAQYAIFGGSLDERRTAGGDNTLEIYVELLPSEQRHIYYRSLARMWQRQCGPIVNAVATEFDTPERGPGGKPLEVMLLAKDQEQLLDAATELKTRMESLLGVYDVQMDYRPGKREYRVSLRPEARPLGLTVADLAQQLRQGFYGDEVLRLQRGRDEVKVKIRYPLKGGRDSIGYFENLRVRTPLGKEVPIGSVARVEVVEGYTTIRRQQGRRTITVSGNVDRQLANAAEIMADLTASFLPGLAARHPGLGYSTEGQAQQTQESLSSLKIGFPLAMLGIYLILATIFHSYVQPVVIMVTIPFGLIGATFGHLLFGKPLTMMSLFGMVALAGIVVNDAIVLIEAVNTRLGAGMPFFDAMREGGKRRFRAIFLTTLTTFAGLTPIILEKSMQAQFLIPMAIAIAFGVAFATLLTLIVIPCILAAVNDLRRLLWFVWHRQWPSREQVEPGVRREGQP